MKRETLILIALFVVGFTVIIGIQSMLHKGGGETAEDFQFTLLNNTKSKLSDYRGKPILIDFMATWCAPCKLQVKVLRSLWPTYKGKVIFLSISVDERDTLGRLRSYGEANNITWIMGSSVEAGLKYKISAIPTLIIVDSDGKIVFKNIGLVTENGLEEKLDDLIGG